MKTKKSILDDENTLILTGKKPLPKGFTIIGNKVFNDEHQALKVRSAINQLLTALTTPEATARSLIDEEYDKKRKEQMIALIKIESQSGFPYDVEWPEEVVYAETSQEPAAM